MSVAGNAQGDEQVLVQLEPHRVVRRNVVRHVVQCTRRGELECMGEPVPIPLVPHQRRGQIGADAIGTPVEVRESRQDPGVVCGIGVIVRPGDAFGRSHLPRRAEIEQFRVEDEKGVEGLGHCGSSAGRVQFGGDPMGIGGAAGLGETPPAELARNTRDEAGHSEIDQLGLDVGFRESGRFGHAGQVGASDAAKGVENQQVNAGGMGRVRHAGMLHR